MGSGAADGWPTPYCRCRSCLAARAAGEHRLPTAALIDGVLQLDAGAHAGTQAVRAGRDLADVRAVLVTHAHSDHLDPAFLLHRGWVDQRPLAVVGPPPVVRICEPWLDPAGTHVRLVAVSAGDRLELDGYEVRVTAAAHEALGECVLYDVTGRDGARLLYATDTGPWAPGFADVVRGLPPYDLVLLEQTFGDRPRQGGHHDLASFADALAGLRDLRLIGERTRVVAVHLSHHNPPPTELAARLEALGAHPGRDLEVLRAPAVPGGAAGP